MGFEAFSLTMLQAMMQAEAADRLVPAARLRVDERQGDRVLLNAAAGKPLRALRTWPAVSLLYDRDSNRLGLRSVSLISHTTTFTIETYRSVDWPYGLEGQELRLALKHWGVGGRDGDLAVDVEAGEGLAIHLDRAPAWAHTCGKERPDGSPLLMIDTDPDVRTCDCHSRPGPTGSR